MKLFDPNTSQLITIQQVAQITNLTVDTIYKMVSQRRVPFVKLGEALRFDPVQLAQWIKQNTVMPMLERRT